VFVFNGDDYVMCVVDVLLYRQCRITWDWRRTWTV